MRRVGLALVAVLLLVPLAGAAPARVRLEAAGGVWNGVSEADVSDGAALLWLPPGARVHAVTLDGAPAEWDAVGPSAIRVRGASGVAGVAFDYAPGPLVLARLVAPGALELTLRVVPEAGNVAVSDDIAFTADGDGFVGATTLGTGDALTIRVVAEDRVGELPVLAVVGLLAFVTLVAGIAWHRARPPVPPGGPVKLLDHLAELQARLLPPVLAFAVLNMFYFVAGLRKVTLAGIPLVAPVLSTGASMATRGYQAIAERLVPPEVELVALRPVDAIFAQVSVCLFLALVTVLPLLLYEVGAFVGPALLARERRLLGRSMPIVVILFLVGAAFGFLLMAPLMVSTLYSYAPIVGARPLLGVGDLVSFALLIVVAFALAFELPVAMYGLARGGLVRAATFRKYLRHAIVVIFVASGILTPDPSVVSQLLVGVPVTALYLLGMGAAKMGEVRRGRATTTS